VLVSYEHSVLYVGRMNHSLQTLVRQMALKVSFCEGWLLILLVLCIMIAVFLFCSNHESGWPHCSSAHSWYVSLSSFKSSNIAAVIISFSYYDFLFTRLCRHVGLCRVYWEATRFLRPCLMLLYMSDPWRKLKFIWICKWWNSVQSLNTGNTGMNN
jgi:hypothetical protein